MNCIVLICVIIFGLIIILIYYFIFQQTTNTTVFAENRSESFDTYYQHDDWAGKFYFPKKQIISDAEEKLAATRAKYDWIEKDKKGENIYDKYYMNIVRERSNAGDPEYFEREVETDDVKDGIYDTKFSTISGNNYAVYNTEAMRDNHPVSFVFNGNVLTLNQKNY